MELRVELDIFSDKENSTFGSRVETSRRLIA